MRTIQRDSSSRITLMRMTIPKHERWSSCAWCGDEGMYRYSWVNDYHPPVWRAEAFCSVGCFRSYLEEGS